jgi:DNA polymerase-3 subunit delta'
MSSGWRPLPWQSDAWSRVASLIAGNRLAHALLLAGPRGVGKAHFALGLASFLLCESPDPVRKPCGECRSCVQIAAGVHPNLLRLAPAEDKRDIAIDDVRALIDRLHLSSHYGQAKVAIIQPADSLNLSGVNALLKTIEEPPAATHLLLVAERWRALPATLRSRCQILRFAPPPAAQALAWLKQNHPGHSAAALSTVVLAPMLAEQILEKETAEARAQWGRALLELAEGRMQALKLADKLKREEAQAGLEFWLYCGTGWLKTLLAPHRAAPATALPVPKSASVGSIQRLLADAVAGLRGLEGNGNPAMIMESIMIRWAKVQG